MMPLDNSGLGSALAPDFSEGDFNTSAYEIFGADPRVRSVGIGRHDGRLSLVAIRNTSVAVPLTQVKELKSFHTLPVNYIDGDRNPESLALRLKIRRRDTPHEKLTVPEQGQHRPVVCGLQVQNFDDDFRTDALKSGHMIVGTIGCMVRLRNGSSGFLSNNHVVAGQNRGHKERDRILQAGIG
jgi:hypothetical protein